MKTNRFILIAFLAVFSGCAMNSDVLILDSQLMDLEQRILALEEINQSGTKENQNLRGSYASLRVEFDNIREQLRMLSGKYEKTEYLLDKQIKAAEHTGNKLENRLEEDITANLNRIRQLEQYLGFETIEKKNDLEKVEGVSSKELSENELYVNAKKMFDQGEFDKSLAGFKTFLNKYPKSTKADNAQFWIGEIYYKEKWYEKAILEYQKVIEKYPKGNKVPASLLKQGLAFNNIGENANARLILKELIKKYPESNETKVAEKKIKEIK